MAIKIFINERYNIYVHHAYTRVKSAEPWDLDAQLSAIQKPQRLVIVALGIIRLPGDPIHLQHVLGKPAIKSKALYQFISNHLQRTIVGLLKISSLTILKF